MGQAIECFWCEPADKVAIFLRRYTSSSVSKCAKTGHYCNAMTPIGEQPARYTPDGYLDSYDHMAPPHDDPRWPLACEACGKPFGVDDEWQVFEYSILRRVDTGAEFPMRKAPPGAMWDAKWYPWKGPDGMSLCVAMPPGGADDVWLVDSRASNCTMPNDNEHRCWVRHGDPRQPQTLTVDKNGHTCAAGAGSIQTSRWHGFLRGGRLLEC